MQPTDIVSRFAPSPSGLLHLGHGFSAVLGERLARKFGGRWLLRIEDIDSTRCRPEFIDAIHADLGWLGLRPDAVSVQSERRSGHEAALARLTEMGLTYPCFCTRADIAAAAAAPHGSQPVYPGTCRGLSAAEAALHAATRDPAIRLDVVKARGLLGSLLWNERFDDDRILLVQADPFDCGDIVLARKDIGVGYMLSCVVDDAADGVTDVVRGRDLFDSTPVQRLLQALLGLASPRYLHHRLLLAPGGRRLAKRDKAETLASLREAGVDGLGLAARLAQLESSGPDIVFLP